MAEVVALQLLASQLAEKLGLKLRLDAFSRTLHTKRPCQPDHGLRDFLTVAPRFDVADKTAIDLDPVERKRAQMVERRKPGSKVIQRDAHTQRSQLMKAAQGKLLVAHQRRFRDLKLEPARIDIACGHCIDDC